MKKFLFLIIIITVIMMGIFSYVFLKKFNSQPDIDYQIYEKRILSIADKYNCDFYETQEEGYKTYNLRIDNYSKIEISFEKNMADNLFEKLFWVERFEVRYLLNYKKKQIIIFTYLLI